MRRSTADEGDDLTERAHESFRAGYRVLGRHVPGAEVREVPGCFAFHTGIPVPLFNGCIATAAVPADRFDAVLDWLAASGAPHHVWLAGDAQVLRDHVLERGLVADEPHPGMILQPAAPAPPPAPGVAVRRIDPTKQADTEAFLTAWSGGEPPSVVVRTLFSPGFMQDLDVDLFIGELDSRPAGTSVAVWDGRTGGVVAVGAQPWARRRGVGTAVSWAAAEAGRARGADAIVLQASPMGFPVYRAMGFRTIVEYETFVTPGD